MAVNDLKILAIDDNQDNLTTLQAVVSDRLPGARVLTALDGPRGLELARSEDPDAILLGLVIPGLDGYEVCRTLKADERLQAIPVLFLTALGTDQASRIAAMDAGAEGFLSKPVDEIELVVQLRAMAKIKAASRHQRLEKDELAALVTQRTVQLVKELSERRSAEADYAALFREMLNGFALHEIITDEHGKPVDYRFLAVNPAFERITGMKAPEIIGKTALEVIPGLERSWIKTYGRVALSGEPITFESHAQALGKYFEVRAFRPAPGRFACLFSDVTERKRVEMELRASEEIFGRFMEYSPIYVFFKDEKMRSLRLSRNFETMLGKPLPELLGKSMDELFPSELAKSMVADDIRTMQEGKVVTVEEKLNGRSYSTIKFPILIGGKPRYLAGYTIDITERARQAEEKAQLEDQLRQAQKVEAIGRLAGGVAHDFNNITAIILGYGEMLQSRLGPEDPLHKYVEQILAAGRRSAGLTRQLLAFSRKQTLQPEVLDLNALLLNFEKMLGRLIGEDIELVFRLAADAGRVLADPGQIEQVVTNLAINARDAMPRGGRLTVETAAVELDAMYAAGHLGVVPGRYVLLALTDSGCGMDKATMSRLFEPFFTTKEKGKGTGLGLATVFGIVKQSGGYIWAYSEPGQGTSFKIYLPQTDAQAESHSSVQAGEAVPRGGGERILLVEDEEALRTLCETVLPRLGYRVSAAGNGLEALRLVQELRFEPDLVLTDVIMPVMGGAELVERLRKDRPGLKVLYMSGYPDDAIAPHGVLEPGIPFIQKPFSKRVLALKIREVLGQPAAAAPTGASVLMIDDDEQYRELVRHFCTKRGHACTGVDSAAAALAALAGQPFDVLLVDLNIPGTSGAAVLREIRAAGHAAPAIVLTGDAASADMEVWRPLGALRALEKSSDGGPLLRAIELAFNSVTGS